MDAIQSSMLVGICFLLIGVEFTRCAQSRIHIGPEMETFVSLSLSSMNVDSFGKYYVTHMEEDEWIEGNILATIGDGVFTVDSSGNSSLIAGSLEPSWLFHVSVMNTTNGLAQLDGGRTLIISDYWGNCLWKFDRVTKNRTLFAGQHRENSNINFGNAHPICSTLQDGPAEDAVFCNPGRLYYKKEENTILVLDIAVDKTLIRELDLTTMIVHTLFYNSTYTARDFLEESDSYIFTVPPGVLELNTLTNRGSWLAGCGNHSFEGGSCKSKLNTDISMTYPMGMFEKDDVLLVADLLLSEVFIVDTKNQEYAKLSVDQNTKVFSVYKPASVALIGDYLYIGESTIVYGYPYWGYSDSYSIDIKRIKFSISTSYDASDSWIHRDPIPVPTTERFKPEPMDGGLVAGIVGAVVAFILVIALRCYCCHKRWKSRRGDMNLTGVTTVPRARLEIATT